MKISTNQATLIGCISPIFWGLSVSLVRTLSETLGVGKGLAINYLIALVFVFLLFGVPNLKAMPLKYYICGLGCAIGTSMTFAFSLGLAKDGTQTMDPFHTGSRVLVESSTCKISFLIKSLIRDFLRI